MPELPTGTVTFLFTDIEGSTRLLQRVGEAYRGLLAVHHRIVRQAIADRGGVEVLAQGDGLFAVFPTAAGALRAAVQAQLDLSNQSWPHDEVVRVRMGLHTGDGVIDDDTYVGLDVHRAARIAAAAHGGQVLISDATRALIGPALPAGVELRNLGSHRLRDIEEPEQLHQLVVHGLPDAFPPIRTPDARRTNLPAERDSFVGREREVSQIGALLVDSRLLTLTGPGGIGKTRLAHKVATNLLGRFADGVYLADLSAIRDPGLVPVAVAGALAIREEPGRDLLGTLADYLRDRDLLLVVDNLEQVVDAAAGIGRLLDAAPGLRVIATSRVPLRIAGEQEFPVPPLGPPSPATPPDIDSITGNDAVTLFMNRAAAVRPGMRLTPDNASTVAEIALKLDGLPLAIELAASRVKLLSPEAILARLGASLSLLTTGPTDSPERHRTLRSTIDWSHDLLEEEHQRLFARLGAFSGGWTLEAAEAICGRGLQVSVIDGLASLVDHSMVQTGDGATGEMRFAMLETIREFALERLALSGEAAVLQRDHAVHFRAFAEAAELRLMGEERLTWLDRLERETDNMRAAMDWAERTGDAETGLRTAAAIWRFWLQRGHMSEGRRRLERLLAMERSSRRDAVQVRALGALGGIAYWQNDYQAMGGAYEEAVVICREMGDPRLLAGALLDQSFVPFVKQDVDRAESILREALATAQRAGDGVLTAEVSSSIAFIEVVRGRPGDAIPLRLSAIETFREAGQAWKVADHLSGLGMISRMAGDLAAARHYLRESLEIFADAGDSLRIGSVLTAFAIVANDDGLPESAARLVGAAARIRDDLGGGIPPELMERWGHPATDAKRVLGDGAYERARAEGYAMAIDAAIAYALEGTGAEPRSRGRC